MLRVILTSIIVYVFSQYLIVGRGGIVPRKARYIFYNVLVVFCVYSFLNMILWNYEVNFLVVIVLFYILSLIMFYVHEFRGTNFNFSDFMSIGTAKEVASGYTYVVKPFFIFAFFIVLFECLVQIKFLKIDLFKNYHKAINKVASINIDIYRYFWHEIGQVLAFFISFFILRDKISSSNFDYSLYAGENEGYIYNFISSIPIFHKSKFNHFETILATKQFIKTIFLNVRKKEKSATQNSYNVIMNKYKSYVSNIDDSPYVIAIMNESFGTLHRYVKTNIPVTPFYDSLSGVIKGNLFVNTFGGGTANTEFEFLTGMTIGNYPYPVMPYNSFVKRNKYSIAKLFNNLGYKTLAMHPYTATNYHRDKVYKHFGFNELLFYKDFKNKEYIRKFVSDESMYEEVIRQYKISKMQEKKMFLFGITMQNHSGYSRFVGQQVLSYTKNYKNREALDAYLSLMKISDNAIKNLVNYFANENRHVVILFFGDHNASFGTEMNKLFYNTSMNYECTNAYITPFFIYDNKYPETKYIKAISANFLSLELLNKARLPFDVLHELLKETYKQYPVYNFHKSMNRKTGELKEIEIDKFMMLEKEYLK